MPLREEPLGVLAAALELEHDIALLPGDGGVEVAGLADLAHQLGGDDFGAAAVVAVVALEHGPRIVVERVEPHHVAGHVVIELYCGVHAEQQRAGGFGGFGGGGDRLYGQALLRQGGGPGAAASGKGQQGGGRGGDTYHFDVELLHFSHLLNI